MSITFWPAQKFWPSDAISAWIETALPRKVQWKQTQCRRCLTTSEPCRPVSSFFSTPPSHPPHSLSLLLFFLLISFSSYRFNSAYARDNLYTPLDSYFDANRFPLLRVSRVTLTKGRGVGRNNVCTLVRRRISFRACRREIRSSNRSATMTRARRTIAWSRC